MFKESSTDKGRFNTYVIPRATVAAANSSRYMLNSCQLYTLKSGAEAQDLKIFPRQLGGV